MLESLLANREELIIPIELYSKIKLTTGKYTISLDDYIKMLIKSTLEEMKDERTI